MAYKSCQHCAELAACAGNQGTLKALAGRGISHAASTGPSRLLQYQNEVPFVDDLWGRIPCTGMGLSS